MARKKWDDTWEEDWEEDWDDEWDDDSRLKSPMQRFTEWIGLNKIRSDQQDAYDDGEGEQGFLVWSRLYWQRSLALVFFLIGLILILRLAVLA